MISKSASESLSERKLKKIYRIPKQNDFIIQRENNSV